MSKQWGPGRGEQAKTETGMCTSLGCSGATMNYSNEVSNSLFLLKSRDMNIVNVKVKVTLEKATKAKRGSRGIAVLFP